MCSQGIINLEQDGALDIEYNTWGNWGWGNCPHSQSWEELGFGSKCSDTEAEILSLAHKNFLTTLIYFQMGGKFGTGDQWSSKYPSHLESWTGLKSIIILSVLKH